MTAHIGTLKTIWEAINHDRPSYYPIDRFIQSDGAQGWQIRDYMDLSLLGCTDVDDLLAAFGYHQEILFPRPRANESTVYGGDGLTLPDITGLLIQMERFGLIVDPQPLVDLIRPRLVKQTHLTQSELRIYWYAKERGRCIERITVDGEIDEPHQFTTKAGYRCFMADAGDNNVRLMVAGPKVAKARIKRKLYSMFPFAFEFRTHAAQAEKKPAVMG